jgi:hypothetical protein
MEGNSCADPTSAFGHHLSKNEALYFTVGTLTTAGTGNLSAQSHSARTTAIYQMTIDVLVLIIGIAGLVRGRSTQSG